MIEDFQYYLIVLGLIIIIIAIIQLYIKIERLNLRFDLLLKIFKEEKRNV